MSYGLLRLLGSHTRHGAARYGLQLTNRTAVPGCIRLSHTTYESWSEGSSLTSTDLHTVSRQRTAYVDYIKDVLHRHQRFDLVPASGSHKPDLSISRARKSIVEPVLSTAVTEREYHHPKLSFRRILASYLEHHLTRTDWSGDLDKAYVLPRKDEDFLTKGALSLEDVAAWARFIVVPDAGEAIQLLVQHESNPGATPFPLPILLYFLRRRSIPSAKLRQYFEHIERAFLRTSSSLLRQSTAMLAFARLIRHARRVLPELMPDITELFLKQLPPGHELSHQVVHERTFMLNRAMTLVSMPTSIRPFQSSEVQQDAAALLLQYMNEHQPALHISREGYQAIVRIQLRLRKTTQERRWASLKALSWPPWKQDRTAMDSEFGPEEGISKAGQSLMRMAEAGYAPGSLENVAHIYSGWNDDGTPTIQKRHILPRKVRRGDHSAVRWAARIDSTRTIQEAWACWLTYEAETPDTKKHSGVMLAILKKLRQHELQSSRPSAKDHSQDTSLPGDGIEVSPLPPSLHQHTYIRTEAPGSYDFFKMIQSANVKPNLILASYLVTNASGLQQAYEYLRYLERWYPGASATFTTQSELSTTQIPALLVAASARALCLFSYETLSTALKGTWVNTPASHLSGNIFHEHAINDQHCLVRAVWLLSQLERQRSSDWQSVFHNLHNSRNGARSRNLTTTARSIYDRNSLYKKQPAPAQKAFQRAFMAVLCYRLTQKVVDIMKHEVRVPVDLRSFFLICEITTNCATACAAISTIHDGPAKNSLYQLCEETGLLEEAARIRDERPGLWLAQLFNSIAGGDTQTGPSAELDLAHGMSIEPATFHAWVRALGLFGDHLALLQLTKMMSMPGALISDGQNVAQVRIVRRALTALRIYLEGLEQQETTTVEQIQRSPQRAASQDVIDEVQALVEESFEDYAIDGEVWASDEEVAEYLNWKRASS